MKTHFSKSFLMFSLLTLISTTGCGVLAAAELFATAYPVATAAAASVTAGAIAGPALASQLEKEQRQHKPATIPSE